MEIIDEPGARIMYSENIPYLRVDLQGLLQAEEYRAALDNAKLWRLVADKRVVAMALNHVPLHKFSTDYVFYMREEWLAAKVAPSTVRKVAVVVPERGRAWELMSPNFKTIVTGGVELRWFAESQFYATAEAIAWF
jgi:hypothetical protein